MAFAQKQRRPVPRYQDIDEQEEVLSESSSHLSSQHQIASDSDNDWHVISTAAPSSTPSSTQSPSLLESESDSLSSFRPSDSDSFSDIDNDIIQSYNFNTIPSHDGTGTFMADSSDINQRMTLSQQQSDNQRMDISTAQTHHSTSDEADTPNITMNSAANILLPYAGLEAPSFIKGHHQQYHDQPPAFVPTAVRLNSQTMSISNDEEDITQDNIVVSDGSSSYSRLMNDNIKFTSKRQRNLDSIPIHHPGLLGSTTSSAILSVVWNSVRRLTNHLIENDSNTVETLSTIMSEAVFEGYLPFGSHLHMDIGGGIRTSYHSSLLEVE